MKKWTALMLALCLALAVVPALGEDASGNWYMTLADITMGRFELNADGTAVIVLPGQDEMSGTWAADGDTVTITVDGAPLDFAFDGTSLKSDKLPIALGREQGRLSMENLTKMMNGETDALPEGMTKEEMMGIAANFMAEYAKFVETADSIIAADTPAADPAAPAAAPADPQASVTVLREDFRVIESYSGFNAVYLAKVQNNTDAPLFLTDGSLQVKDADGNLLDSADYLGASGSRYLEPGEVSFVSMECDLKENVPVTYEASIVAETESYQDTDTVLKAENPEYRKASGEYDSDYLAVTVTNETDQPLSRIKAVLVMEDAEGSLICLNTESLYDYELGAGSAITFVSSVSGKLMDYCKANNVEPAAVEAFAWVENRD